MRAPCRTAATDVALIVGFLALSRAGAAEPVIVRTFDLTGVADREMSTARHAAGAILQEAGLVLEWRDCSAGCVDPPGSHEIMLRIARAPERAEAASLGYAVVDVEAGSGSLATVYADRIAEAAGRAKIGVGRLLGRAIAHELGHLLLGTSRHSERGLMRARWSDRELRRDAAADWILSPDVVAELARRW